MVLQQDRCGASVAIITNPLPGVPPTGLRRVKSGLCISDLVPVEANVVPVVARYNGMWMLRKNWNLRLQHGDVLEFHVYPQGGGGGNSNALRVILAIAIVVVSYGYGAEVGAAILPGATAGTQAAVGSLLISIAGNMILNAAFKPRGIAGFNSAGGIAGSAAYDVALQGNQAKIEQPIPVLYGYNKTFPDFAAQPYQEYNNETDDQYYHALMAVGHGKFTLIAVELDDTNIDHFADVIWRQLQPGEYPAMVLANVVSAPEVIGQELKTGQTVGGFSVCRPTLRATDIGIDLVLGGLGVGQPDGSFSPRTVSVRIDFREIDDFGFAVGSWDTLALEDITAATANPVRRSFKYSLGETAKRVEIRAVRTDLKDDNIQILNTVSWAGLRGYLSVAAPLAPTVTHIEVRIRASEQLSGLTQRRISVRSLRWIEEYNGSTWTLRESRSIAWALADKWRSTVYGDGLPLTRIDLDSLQELDSVWLSRQDRLDYVFDTRITSFEADQLLAGAGRATVVRRQGSVRTVIRDQLQEVPLTAFTSRNIRPGSVNTTYILATEDTTDGVQVEYWNNRIFDWLKITCPAPGLTKEEVQHPLNFRLFGITGSKQAEREGLFLAAAAYYRRKQVTWSTELLGMLPTYGSMVKIAPALHGWGVAGDVVGWEPTKRKMTLSEPVEFVVGVSNFIALQRDNGSYTDNIIVAPGTSSIEVVLSENPDFDILIPDGSREYTKFLFGQEGTVGRNVVVRSMRPSGRDDKGSLVVELTSLTEDERVHAVDLALLPSLDEVQDPIATSELDNPTPAPDLPPVIIGITDHIKIRDEATTGESPYFPMAFRLLATGELQYALNYSAPDWLTIPQEWSLNGTLEVAQAEQYEVYVDIVAGPPEVDNVLVDLHSPSSDPINTWLNMGVDHIWIMDPAVDLFQWFYTTTFRIQIRTASGLIMQDTSKFTLLAMPNYASNPYTSDGP